MKSHMRKLWHGEDWEILSEELNLIQFAAQRTKYVKAKINKTQQNRKCRLCCDRDDTINHIISKCGELAQYEYKTKHDWVSKVTLGIVQEI